MNSTIEKIKNNIPLVIHGAVKVEGVGCTLANTEEILERGKADGVDIYDVNIVLNIKRAYEFLFDNYKYEVELGTCLEYNWYIGTNDVTSNPGYIREDYQVNVSGVYETPSPIYHDEAFELIKYGRTIADPYEQAIYFLSEIHRRQFFCNGNKRTGIMIVNHVMAYNDTGMVFAPQGEIEASNFRQTLCDYENGDIDFVQLCAELDRYFW